jgi:hypothetical protein
MPSNGAEGNITAAVVLAAIVLLIIMCIWPGLAQVRAGDIGGYWASREGKMYEIVPGPSGEYSFEVKGRLGADAPVAGTGARGLISGLRRLQLRQGGGRVAFGGRRIDWGNGDSWVKQGMHTHAGA